jgi:hypothetical protein
MKEVRKYLSIILFILFVFGCTDDAVDNPDEIQRIYYGTAFGECLGYCQKSIEISDRNIKFIKSGWDQEGLLPVKKSSESNSESKWESLLGLVDKENFFDLNAVYGCPDCTDGGTEWIQIEIKDAAYTVSFEYNNEPRALTNIVEELREIMSQFE